MFTFQRILSLLFLTLGLAACGPIYQSVFRYEAPPDAAGRVCLERCADKIAGCRGQCTATSRACLEKLEPLVDERYEAALKAYEIDLERYRQDRVLHDLQLSLNWGRPYPRRHGLWPSPPWGMLDYFAPILPVKPGRSAEFERLRRERCDVDCGCQPVYDACFLACGGKKIPEVKCMKNCPP